MDFPCETVIGQLNQAIVGAARQARIKTSGHADRIRMPAMAEAVTVAIAVGHVPLFRAHAELSGMLTSIHNQREAFNAQGIRMPQPESDQGEEDAPPLPPDCPLGTTMPRHLAGLLDNALAFTLSIVCVQQLPTTEPLIQITGMVVSYLGYFLVFEALWSTTPAKYMNGLVVRDFNGRRCSFRQAVLRTLFRLLEVNPALFGFLPAAARIVWSRDKQRFGDKFAGTVVVFR